MVRTFDHSGYFETRFILMLLALTLALYFYFKKENKNYLVIFISATIFFGIVELVLQLLGMREEGFSISIFGFEIPFYITWLFQGLTEGGIHGVMGYLFLDIFLKKEQNEEYRKSLVLWIIFIIIALIFALIIGVLAKDQPITSVRPMFGMINTIYLTSMIILALILTKYVKINHIFRYLGIYLLGTFIYVLVNLETLHFFNVRYIGIEQTVDTVTMAPLLYQIMFISYSHLIEVTLSRAHYFIIPVILGLINLKRKMD